MRDREIRIGDPFIIIMYCPFMKRTTYANIGRINVRYGMIGDKTCIILNNLSNIVKEHQV